MIYVSPAEHSLPIKNLGTYSSLPERYGADLLFVVKDWGKVGVQRKEQADLISSVRDGRLGKELAQMGALGLGVLIVEGRQKWSNDGWLVSRHQWSLAQQLGVMFSVQAQGVWVVRTDDIADTASCVLMLKAWLEKGEHSGLRQRPKATGEWGKPSSRDWQKHLLSGFDGIGGGVAEKIIDHFGKVPIQWSVTREELMQVKGLGKTRVEKLMGALDG